MYVNEVARAAPLAAPKFVSIPRIQGTGHISPYKDAEVYTTGVVTSVARNGFFMQDPKGDGDDKTSDAVFVFTGDSPNVKKGMFVWVEGTVTEFALDENALTQTQIAGENLVVQPLLADHELPAAVELGTPERPFPRGSLEDAALDYERYEGMRVRLPSSKVVNATNKFGDAYVAPNADTGLPVGDNGLILGSENRPDYPARIKVSFDRALYGERGPKLDVGDSLGPVEGNFLHSFGFYGIKPTAKVDVTKGSLKRDVTSLKGTATGMTVASFNVENLDPKVEDPALLERGRGDDDVGDGRFDAIARQITHNLASPDVVAIQEIQDNTGTEDAHGTTDASKTWETLIEAIVAAGGPRYQWIDSEPRVSGDDGGQPGGNIRVGCLYNPERVELDKDSVKRIGETEPVFEGGRKSLAAAFRFRPTGKTLNVINNHWASKFGSTPTYRNPEVPEVVGGEEERDGQQKVIEVYVEALKAKDPNARILSVGDFNAAGHEPPLRAHGSGVLFNLGEQVPDAERYSYVFQGIAQAIDHQFASRNLAGKVEFEYVNVNAAFADKTADHDPNLSRVDMS